MSQKEDKNQPKKYILKHSDISLDAHGQPLIINFNRTQRIERDISEMLGLCKGLIADGIIVEKEVIFLNQWIANHADVITQWPVNILTQRIQQIFADGHIEETERADLFDILSSIVGGPKEKDISIPTEDVSTRLPIDQPPPPIKWTGSVFVLTGKFASGPRVSCEDKVERLGGICDSDVTERTKYLVIGTFGSRDWIQTPFGRKIESAVKLKTKGFPVAIIAEDYWAKAINEAA
jgi:NAD-dependent DNA ligase